jgi:hypothetical protein
MLVVNYILIFILFILLAFLYQRYLEKRPNTVEIDSYKDIQNHFLNDKTLDKSKKPLLWIYIPYEYNAAHWLSFGSRNSYDLNQPYLYLTVKSIIKNCENSFKIVLIDEGSFEKLIPSWKINMKMVSQPVKMYLQQLGMAKLLHTYGGINVPISFLCFKDLITLYNKGINNDMMFIGENYDYNVTSTTNLFFPDANFIGCKKGNNTMEKYIQHLERIISTDYTSQAEFLGDNEKWCEKKIIKGEIKLINGTELGTRTIDNEPVLIENLLGEEYIHFYGKMYGLWIPNKMIIKRRHYEWFARMSPEQIFNGNFILAKYIVLALAPDSQMGVIEPLENKPNWISFWRVPLTNGTLNVWGPKPVGLGDDIQRASNAGNMN